MKMGSIPVANPSPPQRLCLPRSGLRVAAVFATVVIASIVVLSFAWPTGSKVDQIAWLTAGSTSDFEINQPVRFREQRLWLVRLGDSEFIALKSTSPHAPTPNGGCVVAWRPDFEFMGKRGWFRDPCSGSTWDVAGDLAFGPASGGMDRFPVHIDDGIVRVNVKSVIQGPGGPPE
jgi:hypothetical protein